jgi:hypothetical protein
MLFLLVGPVKTENSDSRRGFGFAGIFVVLI